MIMEKTQHELILIIEPYPETFIYGSASLENLKTG